MICTGSIEAFAASWQWKCCGRWSWNWVSPATSKSIQFHPGKQGTNNKGLFGIIDLL